MKTDVATYHTITSRGNLGVTARVDCDNTVRLLFPQIMDFEGQKSTRWLDRDELLEVRAVINRALDVIP